MFHDFREGGAHIFEAQAAAGGHVHSGKFLLGDDVRVQMKDKLVRVRVHVS